MFYFNFFRSYRIKNCPGHFYSSVTCMQLSIQIKMHPNKVTNISRVLHTIAYIWNILNNLYNRKQLEFQLLSRFFNNSNSVTCLLCINELYVVGGKADCNLYKTRNNKLVFCIYGFIGNDLHTMFRNKRCLCFLSASRLRSRCLGTKLLLLLSINLLFILTMNNSDVK